MNKTILQIVCIALILAFPCGKASGQYKKIPVVVITDLYHPYQDPGDNMDLIMGFGLPDVDLNDKEIYYRPDLDENEKALQQVIPELYISIFTQSLIFKYTVMRKSKLYLIGFVSIGLSSCTPRNNKRGSHPECTQNYSGNGYR